LKALILAAGYATRLYPLTKDFPKPLLEVDGRPIISYILDKISRIRDIDEVFIVTNSKFYPVFKNWLSGFNFAGKITLVDDLTRSNKDRRGAIGDINFVLRKKRIKDDLLIIGGDNLFSSSLSGFIRFAASRKPSITIGVYRLKNLKDAVKYGVVKADRQGRITEFTEKPQRPDSRLVAMCLYYLPSARLELVKKYMDIAGKNDATGRYIAWVNGMDRVYSFMFKGKWYDIGDHKYLNSAKKNFA